MAGNVMRVDDARFEREVLQAEGPVLVDFGATWCPPCKALEPTLEALATDYAGRVKVAQLDVDQSQHTAQRYGIRSLPTLLLFQGGKVVQQLVGAVPRSRLEAVLKQVV